MADRKNERRPVGDARIRQRVCVLDPVVIRDVALLDR